MSAFIDVNNVTNNNDFQKYSTTTDDITPEWDSIETLGFGVSNTRNSVRIIHYCMGTLLVLIGIAGVSGNGLVLYVFTKYRRLRSGGGPLILSLAVGDFGVSILHIMPAYSSFCEAWKFGYLGCELYAVAVGLGGLASLLTLSAIAADRFSVIVGQPLAWLAGKKMVFFIWFVSFLLVTPPLFGWSRYVLEGVGTSCSWDYTSRDLNNRLYYIFILFFGFCVPVFVITVSYIGILRVVCKQSHQMSGVPRNGVVNKRTPTKNDLKTAQVISKHLFNSLKCLFYRKCLLVMSHFWMHATVNDTLAIKSLGFYTKTAECVMSIKNLKNGGGIKVFIFVVSTFCIFKWGFKKQLHVKSKNMPQLPFETILINKN